MNEKLKNIFRQICNAAILSGPTFGIADKICG